MTDSPVDGDAKKSKPRISAKKTLRNNAENAKKGIKDRCVAANLSVGRF
jgi:hypothetical protein